MKNKKAILIVTYGTTVERAAVLYDRFDKTLQDEFKSFKIFWAYTSSIVRKKMSERGILLNDTETALLNLANDGYKRIIIQSLHIIPGVEYHKILQAVSLFNHKKESEGVEVKIGNPLLSSFNDLEKVADALIKNAPNERKKDEALVFMGHGSKHHFSDLIYVAFNSVLEKKDVNSFLGTVEGHPTWENVISDLKNRKVKKVWLIPFMTIVGNHVMNDLTGKDYNSWISSLKREGYKCEVVLKGILDNSSVSSVWIEHLKDILKNET